MQSNNGAGYRLLATSDLHFGVSERGDESTRDLARWMCAQDADALILAGDLGSDLPSLRACLALFAGFSGPKVAVPGNHDVWMSTLAVDSWALHEAILPDTFRAHGFHPLHQAALELPAVSLVGSMGWYDYSFRDDLGISLECYRTKTPPWASRPVWNDARNCRFLVGDEELTETLATRLATQLHSVPKDKPVVAVLHHLATKRLLVHPRILVPPHWRFANAFLGAERFGDILAADARVRQVVSGHIHLARNCRRGNIDLATIGSDYEAKRVVLIDANGVRQIDHQSAS